ncbi:MAG: SAM-dependent methyltransferase [Desulfuromonas sp.]|nr:MAG: SAM-dependent methyltransferase [Desulfuromonas sp.]
MDNENIETIFSGQLKVKKSAEGYRHAIDPFLLCSFAQIKQDESAVDLGCAAGIIPLILATTTDVNQVCGVEIQPDLSDQARENIALNGLQEKINIMNVDLRDIKQEELISDQSFDVVVSNPPYRKIGSGKIAPDDQRATCRHEVQGTINDFLKATAYLLKSGGRAYYIHLPERLPELLRKMEVLHLEPKRVRFVHSKVGEQSVMVLIECRKNGRPGLVVGPPLYIYSGEDYSDEVKAIFRMT